jgi:hypothetical protein
MKWLFALLIVAVVYCFVVAVINIIKNLWTDSRSTLWLVLVTVLPIIGPAIYLSIKKWRVAGVLQ